MVTITVEGVPSALLLRLAAAAASSGRGLNGELIFRLERSASGVAARSCRCGNRPAATRGEITGWGGPASSLTSGQGAGVKGAARGSTPRGG